MKILINCKNKNCKKPFYSDTNQIKRGWGLSCSKSCAAKVREQSKPGYNITTVKENNKIRNGNFSINKFKKDEIEDFDYYDID